MGNPNATYSRIGRAVVLIVILTALDKLLAITKEMLVAYRFGVSPELDAFNVAYALPSTILLYFSGAFGAAFVPIYLEWSHGPSPDRADNHARSILFCASVFFGTLTAIVFIFSPVIFPTLGYGLAPTEKDLGIRIERTLIFLLLFDGSGIVFAGLLHAQKRFANLYLAPVLINATTILFVICGSKYGIHALVWGLLAGTAFKFVYMGMSVHHSGFRITKKVTWHREDLTRFLLVLLPLLGSELIANSNILIDMIMATRLPPGSVSTLRYAYRINDLPIQLVIMAISKAIFPFISEQAIENDIDGLRHVFKRSIQLVGFITFPIMSLIFVFSSDIVYLLFQRGAFDANATLQTAQTLVFYNIGLFFSAYAFINGAFFCALKRTRILLYIGCISFILNLLLNYILMNIFGIKGIALSTSVTLGIVCTIFFYLLQRTLDVRNLAEIFYQLLKIAFAAVCMLALGLVSKEYISILGFGRTLNMMIVGLLITVCYVFMARLLGVEEARIGRRSIGNMFQRSGGPTS